MDKHCVSLELSKQLKIAGWKKETEFWWTQHKEQQDNPAYKDCAMICSKEALEMYPIEFWDVYPAPIASEILEELPLWIKISKGINKNKETEFNVYLGEKEIQYEKSIPNALAKLWLFLKKEEDENDLP